MKILPSIIRTVTPVIVGQVVAWLAMLDVSLSSDAQAGLATFLGGLITAVYYVLARLLEERFPWIGGFLGLAKTPDSYTKPTPKKKRGPKHA